MGIVLLHMDVSILFNPYCQHRKRKMRVNLKLFCGDAMCHVMIEMCFDCVLMCLVQRHYQNQNLRIIISILINIYCNVIYSKYFNPRKKLEMLCLGENLTVIFGCYTRIVYLLYRWCYIVVYILIQIHPPNDVAYITYPRMYAAFINSQNFSLAYIY